MLVAGALASSPVGAQTPALRGDGVVGDFNGDKKTDVANFDTSNGTWHVGLSDGTRFNTSQWADYASSTGWTHRAGDFTGDGLADVFSLKNETGRVNVGVSSASSFTVDEWGNLGFESGWQTFLVGDYDGNGMDDIAAYRKQNETWYVLISSGSGFLAPKAWATPASFGAWSHVAGDFNGDARSDVASFNSESAIWRVGLSTGDGFRVGRWADLSPDDGWSRKRVGDFNGDGRSDIANFFTGAEWRVSVANQDESFMTRVWGSLRPSGGWSDAVVGDFNNDRRDDIASFSGYEASWHVSIASGPTSFTTSEWGDLNAETGWRERHSGDFNGDSLSDVASFHGPTGRWWIGISRSSSFELTDWTQPNGAPEASFSYDCQGFDCQFHDTSSDPGGSIMTHSWDFGDGTTSTDKDPLHTYSNRGTFTVTLTVQDNSGAASSTSQTIQVREVNAAPTARFTYDCDLLTCTFRDNSSDPEGELRLISWDFNDGTTSNKKNPTHTYRKGGSYTVTHKVTDSAGKSSSVKRRVLVLTPHRRWLGMDLVHIQGYLYARGRIRVGDGFVACKSGRDVVIQKRQGDNWVKVVKGRSSRSGRYRVALYYNSELHDRPGAYRAMIPRERPTRRPAHVCLADLSPDRNHRH